MPRPAELGKPPGRRSHPTSKALDSLLYHKKYHATSQKAKDRPFFRGDPAISEGNPPVFRGKTSFFLTKCIVLDSDWAESYAAKRQLVLGLACPPRRDRHLTRRPAFRRSKASLRGRAGHLELFESLTSKYNILYMARMSVYTYTHSCMS